MTYVLTYAVSIQKSVSCWRQQHCQQMSATLATKKEMKEDSDELTLKELPFCESHPGFEFSHLKQRKNEVLPISSLPEDSLCRIQDL